MDIRFIKLLFVFVVIFIMTTCSKPKSANVREKLIATDSLIELKIRSIKINVEVANTPEKRALGLMYRTQLDWNKGMLFIFEREGIYPFWMKSTQIPLSIAFVNRNNVIIDILEMVPNQEEIRYSPSEPFVYALEMNKGWFMENGIKIGDTIYGIPKSKEKN
ncbi:MAG: DUF192 domain-containing protein [candidate division WOR-3 bacterium]|nr:DUF192 domain-containing protein [candidate division WOR-3 bacterium]